MGLAVQGFRVEEFRVLGLRFRLGFRVSRVQRHCAGFASITSEHKYMGHVNRKSKVATRRFTETIQFLSIAVLRV